MFDVIIQAIIGLLGTLALFFTMKKSRIGPIIGIVSQPFWLIMSYDKGLWGLFVVSLAYFGVWIYGLFKDIKWENFKKKQ